MAFIEASKTELKENRKLRREGQQMFSTEQLLYQIEKQPPEVIYKKAVLINFIMFTGIHLRCSLSLIKLLSFEYCEILRTPTHLYHASTDGYFWTDFKKWLLGTLFLNSRFQNHPDSVILQKYQPHLNQRFIHNSAHKPSLKFKFSFQFNPYAFVWN